MIQQRRTGAEQKRAAARNRISALIATLAIAAVLWGRLIFGIDPSISKANVVTADQTASATGTTENNAPVQQETIKLARVNDLSRDLFAFDTELYERKPQKAVVEKVEPKIEQKADPGPVSLVLEATILGSQPRAVINGQTFRIGQSVDGFVILVIGKRHVVVEKDGAQTTLGI
jgi:hypothetical protein